MTRRRKIEIETTLADTRRKILNQRPSPQHSSTEVWVARIVCIVTGIILFTLTFI